MRMESISNLVVWSVTILCLSLLFLVRYRNKSSGSGRRPPGPRPWPIIGNILDLGHVPHRSLVKLKGQYGDVLWLRLGAMNTMAIQSAKAAAELFKKHDLAFAERTVIETMKSHDYHLYSLAIAPYGTYWRVMRRLVTVEMLLHRRIADSAPVRRRCVERMVAWVGEEGEGGREVRVAHMVFLTTFNLLGNLMLSRDLMMDPRGEVGRDFYDAMMGLMEWSGHPNLADLFPCLRWLDPQGLRKRMDRDVGKAIQIASGFVNDRIQELAAAEPDPDGTSRKDFLDVLLNYRGSGKDEPANFSDMEIIVFILEIFMAGSETTSSTTEWVLSELLRDPESMKKAKWELNEVVGAGKKVEESHMESLPYLQAVVKETLRLHPPIPFLVPRRAMHDVVFMGYDIPENTQVLVNAWAIGRDPEVWDHPDAFNPDRFLGSPVDFKGLHYEFIPFGAGRRMCAGVPLASRVLNLIVGSLIHAFDWELGGSLTPHTLDMEDKLGITVRKLNPLMAIPKKSKIVIV